MPERNTSSFERIGYIRNLPIDADINDYESISIIEKNGDRITLYRLSSEREEIDDTSNFSNSWDVFNSYL